MYAVVGYTLSLCAGMRIHHTRRLESRMPGRIVIQKSLAHGLQLNISWHDQNVTIEVITLLYQHKINHSLFRIDADDLNIDLIAKPVPFFSPLADQGVMLLVKDIKVIVDVSQPD